MNYDFVKSALKAKRMTYKDLALAIGVPFNTVAAWFQRKTKKIDVFTLWKIATVLGTEVKNIIPETDLTGIGSRNEESEDKTMGSTVDFNNFFTDMMDELHRKAAEEAERREEEQAKREEIKRKGEEAAEAAWSTYDAMVNIGFTPTQAMDLLKAVLTNCTVGGGK